MKWTRFQSHPMAREELMASFCSRQIHRPYQSSTQHIVRTQAGGESVTHGADLLESHSVPARATDASAVHGNKGVHAVAAAVADTEAIGHVVGIDAVAGGADAIAGAHRVCVNAGANAAACALAVARGA